MSVRNDREADSALEQIYDRLGALKHYFSDDAYSEIMINGPDDVHVTERGVKKQIDVKLSAEDTLAAITIAANRSGVGIKPDTENCDLDCDWPGARITAAVSPVVRQPFMCIRKHSRLKFKFRDFVTQGMMSEDLCLTLEEAVAREKNILVVGGTHSGKTTFLRALIEIVDPGQRVITVEDQRELDVQLPNVVSFFAAKHLGKSFQFLVRKAMRSAPDRIMFGELRDGAAFDFLKATNTGHDGCMATIHANSALEGLVRFEDLAMEANAGLPLLAVQKRIAKLIHYVVFLVERKGKRQVAELLKLDGFDIERQSYIYTYLYGDD